MKIATEKELLNNLDNWEFYLRYKIPFKLIEKYQEKINWFWVSGFQKLSEKFIEEYRDRMSWILISKYQKLSENFIDKYRDRVCWRQISIHQKLSEIFKIKYKASLKQWEYVKPRKVDEYKIPVYFERTFAFLEV